MEQKEEKSLIIKIIAFAIFVGIVLFVSIKYTPEIMALIVNMRKFSDFINSYGFWGILVYIFFQIIHVVIVVIPGEIVQLAGGYIYGTFLGSIYTFIGMFIGVVIVFFATRLFGFTVVKFFIPKDKLEKYTYLINNPRAEIIMFVLFLIPGVPKDALTYMAGLTPVKPIRFLILTSVARFPGILGSCYIGANLQTEHYTPVIVISSIALILFVVGIIYHSKVIDVLHVFKIKLKEYLKRK